MGGCDKDVGEADKEFEEGEGGSVGGRMGRGGEAEGESDALARVRFVQPDCVSVSLDDSRSILCGLGAYLVGLSIG